MTARRGSPHDGTTCRCAGRLALLSVVMVVAGCGGSAADRSADGRGVSDLGVGKLAQAAPPGALPDLSVAVQLLASRCSDIRSPAQAQQLVAAAGRANGFGADDPRWFAASQAVVGGIATAAGGVGSTPCRPFLGPWFEAAAAPTTIPTSTATTTTTSPPATTLAAGPDVRLVSFRKVERGMSAARVEAELGSPGTVISESTIGRYTDQVRRWTGCCAPYALVYVEFRNARVVAATQWGLN
ncbi:MAG: hypothetical protein JWM89_941 [Acidimicrobiales bacterium]|nr:hypothetical protein [Acidimicrobiales bacterium]